MAERDEVEGEPDAEQGALDSIRAHHGAGADPEIDLDTDVDPQGPAVAPDVAARSPRYTVRDEIARGGMGAILRVRDRDLRRSLAMKVLLGAGGAVGAPVERDRLNRFLEEAQVTAQLNHPGVVPVHELGIDSEGRVFFTMSLVRGKTFGEIVELARGGSGGWSMTRALQVLLRVCETMAYAHDKGVIHRDLKPANVMVGKFGQTYVMDWGLAKVVGHDDAHDIRLRDVDLELLSRIETLRAGETAAHDSPIMTMDGAVVGTPAYMPPEQAEGRTEEVDARSDVYAIGALLYELLTGQAPYVKRGARISPHAVLVAVHMGPPNPVHEIDAAAPEELQAICEKAMARDRGERYASAKEVAADLQRFLSGHVVRAHKTGAVVEFSKWVRRNRAVAATALIGLVALGLATAVYVRSVQDARDDLRAAEATSRERLAHALTYRGTEYLERGDLSAALLWFVEALPLLQDDPDGARLQRIRIAAAIEGHPCLLRMRGTRSDSDPSFAKDGRTVAVTNGTSARVVETMTGEAVSPLIEVGGGGGSVLLSPDGARLLVFGGDAPSLWDVASGERVPLAAEEAVSGTAFGPRGKLLAVASGDYGVRVHDAETGRAVTPRLAQGSPIDTAAISQDGESLLVASAWREDLTVGVWEIPGGRPVVAAREYSQSGSHAGFLSPRGDRFLVGRELLSRTAQRFEKLPWSGDTVIASAVSPDGRFVATATHGGDVCVWDTGTMERLGATREHPAPVRHLEFSPDGEMIATAADDHGVRIWSTAGGDALAPALRHERELTVVAFASDARLITGTGRTQCAWREWDLAAARVSLGPGPAVTDAAAMSPDGRLAAIVDEEHVTIFRTSDGETLWRIASRQRGLESVEFDPTARWLLVEDYTVPGGEPYELRLFDAQTGRPAGPPIGFSSSAVTQMSPDGTRLRTILDGALRVWDAATCRPLGAPIEHENDLSDVAFSRDGRRIATLSDDDVARAWDAETGEGLSPTMTHGGARSLSFSPSGDRLLTMGDALQQWDVRTGESMWELQQMGHVRSAAYSPDGARIVTVSIARQSPVRARVWDAATGEALSPPITHDSVGSARFTQDGLAILTHAAYPAATSAARAWDAATGLPITRPISLGPYPCGARFSVDGGQLMVLARDRTLQTWNLTPDQRSVEAIGRDARRLAGHRLDPTGALVPLSPDELTELMR